MPKYKVLVSPNTLLPVLDKYKHLLIENNIEVITPPNFNEFLSEDELIPLVKDIDGAICGDDRYTEKVLKKAKKLKVLSKWGEGLNAIDLNAAKKLNISVYRTAGALSDPVADTVMAYILAFARNIIIKDNSMKRGEWKKYPSVTLKESILGIIGFGKIGKAIAKRAVSFGMEVVVCDVRNISNKSLDKYGVQIKPFDEVLAKSDFVSINCDLNPSSTNIIGSNELLLMKKNAILINAARGEMIDETALINALKNKIIEGAALDVFEKEPLSIDSSLRKMSNCLISAHNSNASPAVFDFIHRKTIKNVIKGLNNIISQ
jgi:D-3-phosphoglycerate dehydrogenase / 2-oxoglutarate reductase